MSNKVELNITLGGRAVFTETIWKYGLTGSGIQELRKLGNKIRKVIHIE